MTPLLWLWLATLMTSGPQAYEQKHTQLHTNPAADPPTYIVGRATFYGGDLMERVAAKRGIAMAGGADGFSAYPDCRMLGRYLEVSVLDPRSGRWSGWERKRIVDCSEPQDYNRHVQEGLVELSYSDAVHYGYALEGRTRIRFYLVPLLTTK